MKFLKIPILFLWRMWFYILFLITILAMIPFLLILTSDEKYYATFWKMVRIWAKILVYGMGFRLKVFADQHIKKNKSYLFCPIHSSLLDAFILIILSLIGLLLVMLSFFYFDAVMVALIVLGLLVSYWLGYNRHS